MLCELTEAWPNNFWVTWIVVTSLAFVTLMSLSGTIFYYYYVKATWETWRYKSNPKYPDASKVRDEIITMLKGLLSASFCPALSFYMAGRGLSQGYCGLGDYGWGWLIGQFFVFMILSDFVEFYYHRMGHIFEQCWSVHKSHHVFSNPTPFAVIADEYLDQFIRATPLVLIPIIFPANIDLLFFQYAVFFYAYGVYLHWGHELPFLSAHNPYINTAHQHYLHHAISVKNKPYHTGFFFKIWDQLFGSMYEGDCFCVECETKKGERTPEKFKQVQIPDYSPLLDPSFWFNPKTKAN